MGRYSTRIAIAVVAAGCGFSPGGGPDVDGGLNPDEKRLTITDDSQGDFAAGTIANGTVAMRGALEPDAYVLNGLRARAFAGNLVSHTSTWGPLDALANATGFAYQQTPADWHGDRPYGLGLSSSNDFTILYDGELLLPAGDSSIHIDSDDESLLDVSLDGGASFMTIHRNETLGPLHVDAPAWVPVHIAYSEHNGDAHMFFQIASGGAGMQNVQPMQLRARVTDQRGVLATMYTSNGLQNPSPYPLAVSAIDQSWSYGAPTFDIPGLPGDLFTVRYTGQIYIDAADTYRFRPSIADQNGVQNDDQYRVLVDGIPAVTYWYSHRGDPANIPLAAGWHDLLVDYEDRAGEAKITLTMARGTDNFVPVDSTHLRPAAASGMVAPIAQPVDPGGGANPMIDVKFTLAAVPDDAVIDFADLAAAVATVDAAHLTLQWFDCVAGTDNGGLAPDAYIINLWDSLHRTACAGMRVADTNLPWHLTATATGGAVGSTVNNPYLMVTYHGGPQQPFAREYTYVSAPHATANAKRLGAIRTTSALHGATAHIFVRTDGDWVEVADGQAPAIEAGASVQYKLVIDGDGWEFSSVDKVEIDYVVPDN